MSTELQQEEGLNSSEPLLNAWQQGLVQRKCECSSSLGGNCAECKSKKLGLQRLSKDRPTLLDSSSYTNNVFAPPRDNSSRGNSSGHNFGFLSMSSRPLVQKKAALSEPMDRHEQEADRVAQAITGTVPNNDAQQHQPELSRAEPQIQREISSSPNEPEGAEVSSAPSLIVEDDTTEVQPHQMRKSEFLAQLSSELYSTAEPILATKGRTAANCPYLVNWINYGYLRSSSYVETFVRRFGGVTTTVASAREYIPAVRERLRQSLIVWAESGRITGIPADLESDVVATNEMSQVERVGERVQPEATASSSGAVQAKVADGLSSPASDPATVRNELSAGAPLESNTRRRMESAFGYSFSRVRVHDDAKASSLATRLNARAFTVGHDVAFAAGEYSPGSLVGDALLAHELAHVVQQGGGATADLAEKSDNSPYSSLETDADYSAVSAVVSLWGKGKLAELKSNSFPRLRSGLRLSRCDSCSCSSTPKDAGQDAPVDAGPDAPIPDAAPTSVCNLTPTADDQAVLDSINKFSQAERLRFLTGRMDPASKAFTDTQTSINSRVNTQVGELNNIKPTNLKQIKVISSYRGFLANPKSSGGSPQAQIVFEKFFLTGSRSGGWDSFPDAFKKADGTPDRDLWLKASTLTRLQHILRFSAVPGASRHHWHTDVDFNSTKTSDWVAPGPLATLGTWLSSNACRKGFVQAYTPGRSGGHAEEQWHYSYAPIAIGLRQLYGAQVLPAATLESEVFTPLIAEFTSRAANAKVKMPADFETGLRQLNIAEYVNTIEPSL